MLCPVLLERKCWHCVGVTHSREILQPARDPVELRATLCFLLHIFNQPGRLQADRELQPLFSHATSVATTVEFVVMEDDTKKFIENSRKIPKISEMAQIDQGIDPQPLGRLPGQKTGQYEGRTRDLGVSRQPASFSRTLLSWRITGWNLLAPRSNQLS